MAVHSSNQAEAGVLRHVALDEQGADLGIQTERQQSRRRVEGAGAQHRRLDVQRQGVQVDQAVERVVLVLERHPVAEGTEVAAQMEIPEGCTPTAP